MSDPASQDALAETLAPEALRKEATEIERLLKRYLEDRDFLAGSPSHHLLYFVDAHELKSFIQPKRLEDPRNGFMLDAERAMQHPDPGRFVIDMKLKNDGLIADLALHSDARQAGLLPSHAEELEDEFLYQNSLAVPETIGLFARATEQLRTKRDSQVLRRISALAEAGPMNPAQVADALRIITELAPALLALLRPQPDDTWRRMTKVLDHSALRLPQQIDWKAFGFDAACCERLDRHEPEPGLVQAWRRCLSSGRPNSSFRANRVDAEAIAWLDGLNRLLRDMAPAPVDAPARASNDAARVAATPRLRAILVTRAWALTALCADPDATGRHGVKPADFLRHPRLTVLNGSVDALHEGRAASDRAEQVLAVALDTYQKQISLAAESKRPEAAWVGSAVTSLVTAFHRFEQARFALGLRSGEETRTGEIAAISSDELRSLVRRFKTDDGLMSALKDDLLASVQHFGEAIFGLRHRRLDRSRARVRARVWISGAGLQRLVLPLIGPWVGPVDFRGAPQPAGDDVGRLEEQVALLSGGGPGREGWSYLGWALLLVSERQYASAEIYAVGARDIATVLGKGEQGALLGEATLLARQIRRLRLDRSASRHGSKAIRDAERLLDDASAPQDWRDAAERAALWLELILLPAPAAGHWQDWGAFRALIEQALALSCEDELATACILGHGLAGCLAASQPEKPGGSAAKTRPAPSLLPLEAWHELLHAAMTRLAFRDGGFDGLPPMARAMHLLGFQMLQPVPQSGVEPGPAEAARLLVPANLRLEASRIERHLRQAWPESELTGAHAAGGQTAKLVFGALRLFFLRLERFLQRDLAFAPIWTADTAVEIVGLIADRSTAARVERAYELLGELAGASQRYGVFEADRDDLNEVTALLGTALDALAPALNTGSAELDRCCYFLWMEHCYARMLLARLAPPDERVAQFEALVTDFQAVVARFPNAFIPHFRLSILFDRLGRPAAEIRHALDQAAARAKCDPFEVVPDSHWIHSTIRRRQVVLRLAPLEMRRHEALRDPKLRERYLLDVARAYRDLSDGSRPGCLAAASQEPGAGPGVDSGSGAGDFLAATEATRTLNNRVFYASLLLEIDRGGEALATCGLDRTTLGRLARQLHPLGLEAVADPVVVHTIGLAYHLCGMKEAADAGRHLRQLLLDGDDQTSDGSRQHNREAALWIDGPNVGMDRAVGGFSENQAGFANSPESA